MKNLIKQILPKSTRKVLHYCNLQVRKYLYKGSKHYCICCDSTYRRFLAMKEGSHPRDHVVCPGCGSVERHRMLLHYLKENQSKIFKNNDKIMYVAPMGGIKKYLKSLSNIHYLGVDLESAEADEHFDLQEIPYPNHTYNLIICSHTLAHIPIDIKALKEMYRILKKGGTLLVMERIYDNEKTHENNNATTEKERLENFHQADRWRIYGNDFKSRINKIGFKVEEVFPAISYPKPLLFRESINPNEQIFICKKQ